MNNQPSTVECTNLTSPIPTQASHCCQFSLTVVANFPRNSMMIIYQFNRDKDAFKMLPTKKINKIMNDMPIHLKYKSHSHNSDEETVLSHSLENIHPFWFSSIEFIEYLSVETL